MPPPTTWRPLSLFASPTPSPTRTLIILNQPITRPDLLPNLWHSCATRICADGGANRLRTADPEGRFVPDLIKGDLDSLRDETRAFYEGKGAQIKQDHSQDSTDLMKCFEEVPPTHEVLLLGGLSGRLDQTVHVLSQIHKLQPTRPSAIYVLSESSLAWVLHPSSHTLHLPHSHFGKTCGVLPLAVEWARVKTRGLEWDLGGPVLERTGFGGVVSSSNWLNGEVVEVETDRAVWWTVEVRGGDE